MISSTLMVASCPCHAEVWHYCSLADGYPRSVTALAVMESWVDVNPTFIIPERLRSYPDRCKNCADETGNSPGQ